MPWRSEHEKKGFVSLQFLDNTKKFLPRNEWDGLVQAMRNGQRFYEATDLYGNCYLVVLSTLSDICDYTAESIATLDAQADEQKAADAIAGTSSE